MPEGDGPWTRDESWDSQIARAIESNRARTVPKFVDGPLASSKSKLLKDHEPLRQLLGADRHLRAVDMETAGVAKACQRHDRVTPFLSVRAISDVVGLPRDERWTIYACNVAAAFAHALLRSGLLPIDHLCAQSMIEEPSELPGRRSAH